ncbi:hypothetical protein TWF694_007224 [Orbilia ellipsospora]|uniref:Histidine acid phosphatase n=1 Tax=Orbilia ellipsospora TaxID=2528407 RepID=A0AAV9XH85_9PEZI
MKVSSIITSAGLLGAAYAQSTESPVLATNGTVLAVFVYHNNCERTSLWLPDGTQGGQFGMPGAYQCFNDGVFYFNKYLREASDLKIYGTSQIYNADYVDAETPDVSISSQSAMAFLQGIFPPVDLVSTVTSSDGESLLDADNSTFMNGPLQGYQYAPVVTYRSSDPQSIWIAGNLQQCDNQKNSMNLYFGSDDYRAVFQEAQPFYNSLYEEYFKGVFDLNLMVFFNAYVLYDYVYQNRLAGNETLLKMSDEDFQQLRVYANHLEFNMYANTTTSADPNWKQADPTQNLREMGGRLLAGKIARTFRDTLASGGWQNKLNVIVGNFDLMLSWFSLANLPSRSQDFYGLPDLGASMVFELYTDDPTLSVDGKIDPESIKVAFGFRNGTSTNDTLTYWPLFNDQPQGDPVSMVLNNFLTHLDSIAIDNVGQWCSLCNSQEVAFCSTAAASPNGAPTPSPSSSNSQAVSSGSHGMSPAVGGVIGAIIALAIVGIVIAVGVCCFGFGVTRGRRRSSALGSFSLRQPKEKVTSDIELPLSPTAAPMAGYPDEQEFEYNTVSTVVASPLASPEEAHFKN